MNDPRSPRLTRVGSFRRMQDLASFRRRDLGSFRRRIWVRFIEGVKSRMETTRQCRHRCRSIGCPSSLSSRGSFRVTVGTKIWLRFVAGTWLRFVVGDLGSFRHRVRWVRPVSPEGNRDGPAGRRRDFCADFGRDGRASPGVLFRLVRHLGTRSRGRLGNQEKVGSRIARLYYRCPEGKLTGSVADSATRERRPGARHRPTCRAGRIDSRATGPGDYTAGRRAESPGRSRRCGAWSTCA